MSDIGNLDVMLGSCHRDDCEIQNANYEGEIDGGQLDERKVQTRMKITIDLT